MGSRTFDDSTGTHWEVFEVHRTSQKPQAVSAGMESGWLSFVSAAEKRRLAPFPRDWEQQPDAELERLCGMARVAVVPEFVARARPPRPDRARADQTSAGPAGAGPQGAEKAIARVSGSSPVQRSTPELPILRPDEWADVERVVREFALEARTLEMPAIEAMVRLKARLLERYPADDHAARDMRRVRRWFVESYYFERNA
jgi:hypothetical protein